MDGAVPAPFLERALQARHPAVRAAASLLAWPQRRDQAILDNLLHGALGCNRDLADACRGALRPYEPELLAAAQAAWQRNAEPDLYGDLHPFASEPRAWLGRFVRAGRGQ
jgi:hypothetical protein